MKHNLRVLLIVSLVALALVLAFASVQAVPSATLTVNFPGVTVGHVWVRLAGTNTDVVTPLGAQTDSVAISVPNGIYDVWVQQGSGVYEKQLNIDCTGATCTATFAVSNLTVNFTGVSVGNVLVRAPGTNSDVIPWSGAKTDSYGPVNLLADTYDVWAQQGNGKWEIIANVDCTAGGACTATYVIANLTVNFPGVTVGNVWIRQSGGTSNDVVPPLGGKTDSAGPVNLLADTYDVWIQQGSGAYEKKLDVNCSAAGPCSADFAVKTLTVNFTGVTVSNIWVRKAGTNSDVVPPLGSKTDTATTNVLADIYDVWVQQGSGAYEKKLNVDCTDPSGPCVANYGVATLTVPFAGFSSVNVWVRVPDGSACAANGGTAISGSGLSNQGVFKVLQDNYDVITQVAGNYYTYDNINCTGATCTAQPTLTVNFPGINGVHTYVKQSNGVAGTATGADVANQTYKNNQAVFTNLAPGKYDVVVVQGAMNKVIDDVMVFGSCASVSNIVATLTVNFPGISGVHTYVKTNDGFANSFTGGDVTNTTYKNNTTTMTVLKGVYDVKVVQGAQQNIYDGVDCTSGTCTIDNIVATLTVNFPGISGVHTYVKTNDGTPGSFTGGDVTNTTYKNDTTMMTVLKGVYDVKVVQGAQQNIYDGVDCTSGTCTIDNIVATLTVNFPGISGVHTYVKTNDGIANSFMGGDVTNTTYKNNTTTMTVLKGVYDVKVVQGAQQNIYDGVDCTSGSCTVTDIVATLTVNFPGFSGVHTYVKTNDGIVNSSTGGDVTNTTYKNNTTTMALLKGFYDVVLRIGANTYLWDAVDCTGNTCLLDKSTLTVQFPGLSSVRVEIRNNDGTANSATGSLVTAKDNQSGQAVFTGLTSGVYDVVLKKGAKTKIVDAVMVFGSNATVSGIVSTLNVDYEGLTAVRIEIRVTDGAAGTAGGEMYSMDNQSGQKAYPVFKNTYDLVFKKGAKTLVVDNVNCLSDTCAALDIVKTLAVDYEGLTAVRIEIRLTDGVAGTAGGEMYSMDNQSSAKTYPVLNNTYDLVFKKGAKTFVVDNVNCTADASCTPGDIVKTLSVDYEGLTAVRIEIHVTDGVAGTVGGEMYSMDNQSGQKTYPVLNNTYDLVFKKGAKTFVVDNVDCTADASCTPGDIVKTLSVDYEGLTAVRIEIHVTDGVAGTVGGEMYSMDNQSGQKTYPVLNNTYDLVFKKGAKTLVVDNVDCTADASCTPGDIISTLTVAYGSLTAVRIEIRLNDGVAGTAGAEMYSMDNQSGTKTYDVLKNTYDLVFKKGVLTTVTDAVNCTGNTCAVTLTTIHVQNTGGTAQSGKLIRIYPSVGATPLQSQQTSAGGDAFFFLAPGGYRYSVENLSVEGPKIPITVNGTPGTHTFVIP